MDADRNNVIGRLGPGDYFGILGMLFGERHKVSVVAETNCEIIQISGEDLDRITANHPDVKRSENFIICRKYLLSILSIFLVS